MRTYTLDSGIRGTCADEDARIAELMRENEELQAEVDALQWKLGERGLV